MLQYFHISGDVANETKNSVSFLTTRHGTRLIDSIGRQTCTKNQQDSHFFH